MSATRSSELHPDEKVKLGASAGRIIGAGLGIGVLFLALTLVLGFARGDDLRRFYFSYLTAFAYFLSIALGALFFVVLQHLVRARWSVVVRRLAEGITGAFPLLFVLALGIVVPMILGYEDLYYWSSELATSKLPSGEDFDHLVAVKTPYLNTPFFAVRVLIYFLVWIGLSRYFRGKSVQQDEVGGWEISEKLRVAAGPSIIAFALTLAFASFDFLMSLNPHWFSTIYSVWYFAGGALSIMCVLVLVSLMLQRSGRLRHSITVEHYHDLGKLMFAFVFFWGYVSFSQFMLIWYANIPEETIWYKYRLFTSWKWVSLALLFLHFIIPFVLLLSRHTKRRLQSLAFFAVYLLVMRWVDIYWNVMPEYPRYDADWHELPMAYNGVNFHVMDITATIGIGGLFVAAVVMTMRKARLLPVKDPRLADSVSFENF